LSRDRALSFCHLDTQTKLHGAVSRIDLFRSNLIAGRRRFRKLSRHSLIGSSLTSREVPLHSLAATHLTVRALILEEAPIPAMAQVSMDAEPVRGNEWRDAAYTR
jgi:hypothetical protein